MNAFDFIKKIETSYDVTTIKIKDMEVWPFLRIAYFFAYRDKYDFNVGHKNGSKLKKVIKTLKNAFYGIRNYIRKYDYIVLSNIGEIRIVNGKYVNKLLFYLISQLGKEKVLLIENPSRSTHYSLKFVSTKNIVSSKLFLILSYLPFFRKKLKISNESILKDININYKINVNYNAIINKFICYISLFKLLFRIYKPKKIFVTQYYSLFHQAALYSANKLNINTIEFQHGIINDQHIAYNIHKKLDMNFFPKYLFVFGDQVKSVFQEKNNFICNKYIIPIGNMYIDYIKNDYIKSNKTNELFDSLRGQYKKIVSISSQHTIENELIKFLKKLASLNKQVLYIFVPRDVNKNYSENRFPKNIIILKNFNVYQIITESDFHATVYSTCALEAPALGIPNILINLNGWAKKYYSNILTNPDTTRFVDTEEDFLKLVLTWNIKNKTEIMKIHNDFYEKDHKKSLRKALQSI